MEGCGDKRFLTKQITQWQKPELIQLFDLKIDKVKLPTAHPHCYCNSMIDLHIKVQVRYSICYQVLCSFCFFSVTKKCMGVVEFSVIFNK